MIPPFSNSIRRLFNSNNLHNEDTGISIESVRKSPTKQLKLNAVKEYAI